MGEWLRAFFDSRMLSPHGICLLWRPELLLTHAISDLLIGLAYFSIPLAMAVFLYHRRDVRFSWAIWMFVAFIMLCGVTHFMMIWTLWNPDYGVEALVKAATASVSIVTALALWPLLPKAIAIPSTADLQRQIDERDAALAQLETAMASMVRMEEHQRQQDRMLAEMARAEARFRSVFENAAVGMSRVAIDGRFLEVNARFAEIAGWSVDELLGGDFQKITYEEDLESDLAHVRDLLDGRAGRYVMEKRYVRKDGAPTWVRLTVSLVRDDAGTPDHFVAIIEDIAMERRARETRDLLVREVDHRARNALAVVQSVVRLTDAGDPEAYKGVVAGRVDALARAQASLSRSNWQGALMAEVVRDELSSTGVDPTRWTASGPEIELASEHVQPLGMVLHELLTNAVKYGALSMKGGLVKVSWASEAGGGWRLCWAEAGGPAVTPPTRAGFGSRLIERLAEQLNGAASFDWAAEGLTVEVVSAAVERRGGDPHPFIGAIARLRSQADLDADGAMGSDG